MRVKCAIDLKVFISVFLCVGGIIIIIMQVDLYSIRVDTKLLESHILFDVVFSVT